MSPPDPAAGMPGPLAEPLHLLEPTWSLWPALLLGLAASLLFAWLRRRFRRQMERRRQGKVERPLATVSSDGSGEASGIEQRIEELRRSHSSPFARRQGCHELSHLMRGHLVRSLAGHPVPTDPDSLTGREMGRLFGGAVHRFFLHLTSLQFGRREPQDGEFETVCEMAVEVVRSAPQPKRRWGRRGGEVGAASAAAAVEETA